MSTHLCLTCLPLYYRVELEDRQDLEYIERLKHRPDTVVLASVDLSAYDSTKLLGFDPFS